MQPVEARLDVGRDRTGRPILEVGSNGHSVLAVLPGHLRGATDGADTGDLAQPDSGAAGGNHRDFGKLVDPAPIIGAEDDVDVPAPGPVRSERARHAAGQSGPQHTRDLARTQPEVSRALAIDVHHQLRLANDSSVADVHGPRHAPHHVSDLASQSRQDLLIASQDLHLHAPAAAAAERTLGMRLELQARDIAPEAADFVGHLC